jgi:hypothetical protein
MRRRGAALLARLPRLSKHQHSLELAAMSSSPAREASSSRAGAAAAPSSSPPAAPPPPPLPLPPDIEAAHAAACARGEDG